MPGLPGHTPRLSASRRTVVARPALTRHLDSSLPCSSASRPLPVAIEEKALGSNLNSLTLHEAPTESEYGLRAVEVNSRKLSESTAPTLSSVVRATTNSGSCYEYRSKRNHSCVYNYKPWARASEAGAW